MKLYKLTTGLGDYFVIANDPTEAEQKLSRLLNENNYGFFKRQNGNQIRSISRRGRR